LARPAPGDVPEAQYDAPSAPRSDDLLERSSIVLMEVLQMRRFISDRLAVRHRTPSFRDTQD
jgi:hypothetical protein